MAKKDERPPIAADRNILTKSMDDVMHESMLPLSLIHISEPTRRS